MELTKSIPLGVCHQKTGTEEFIGLDPNKKTTVLDFWAWAFSDLASNGNRGILGEFIVGSALGCLVSSRKEWSSIDLVYRGRNIEVKTTGIVQAWNQKSPTKCIFTISPTKFWNEKDNTYSTDKKRWADIYIFCYLGENDITEYDPLDMAQWSFYLIPTKILDERFPNQKRITLSVIKNCAMGPYTAIELKPSVDILINSLSD